MARPGLARRRLDPHGADPRGDRRRLRVRPVGPPRARPLALDRLQRIAYNLDAPVGRDRAALLDGVCAALADAATVRAKFAAAPEATKDLLLSLAAGDPFYFDPRQMGALRTNRPTPLRWAVDHGMVMWDPAGMAAVLPSEVGVALRQELATGFRADFDPAPPLQVPVEVSVEMVERDAAAAIRPRSPTSPPCWRSAAGRRCRC